MNTFTSANRDNSKRRHSWRQIVFIVLLIIVFLVSATYVFDRYIKWNVFPKRWGVVEQSVIFRSGQLSPPQISKQIKKHDIDVIVSLMSPLPGDVAYEAENKAINDYGIERFEYPLLGDGTGDIDQYASAIAKIHESVQSGRVVLVHCAAGTQRTGGVIASYRMLVQNRSVEEAVEEMKKYGWRHKKNPALVPYINQHMSELVDLLVKNGTLEHPPESLPVLGESL